jgi:carbon-monoxide dehydrogenase medium subunit
LDEAGELMERFAPDARLLAGGTDLLVDLKTNRVTAQHLVGIGRIDSMRCVATDKGQLRIGALTTPNQLSADRNVCERFDPILDATRDMASPQIRNVATVGGNITSAVPCADLPPILMVMKASVALWSRGGERQLLLDSFFVGPRQTELRVGEVLKEVIVPAPPPRFGSAYARFALRDGNAIAVASVAAGLLLDDDDTIRDARIVLGAVAPIPKLVLHAASRLKGQPANEDAFGAAAEAAAEEAEPISDVRGSAGFRRELVCVLTRRALMKARHRIREDVR